MRSAALLAFSLFLILSASSWDEIPDPAFAPIPLFQPLGPSGPSDSLLIQVSILEAKRSLQYKEAYESLFSLASSNIDASNRIARSYNHLVAECRSLQSSVIFDRLVFSAIGVAAGILAGSAAVALLR